MRDTPRAMRVNRAAALLVVREVCLDRNLCEGNKNAGNY